jgi:hypothetical protein
MNPFDKTKRTMKKTLFHPFVYMSIAFDLHPLENKMIT